MELWIIILVFVLAAGGGVWLGWMLGYSEGYTARDNEDVAAKLTEAELKMMRPGG